MLSKSMFAPTPSHVAGCSEFIYCSPSSDSGRHSRNGSRGFLFSPSFTPRTGWDLECRRQWGDGVCKLPIYSLLLLFFSHPVFFSFLFFFFSERIFRWSEICWYHRKRNSFENGGGDRARLRIDWINGCGGLCVSDVLSNVLRERDCK